MARIRVARVGSQVGAWVLMPRCDSLLPQQTKCGGARIKPPRSQTNFYTLPCTHHAFQDEKACNRPFRIETTYCSALGPRYPQSLHARVQSLAFRLSYNPLGALHLQGPEAMFRVTRGVCYMDRHYLQESPLVSTYLPRKRQKAHAA